MKLPIAFLLFITTCIACINDADDSKSPASDSRDGLRYLALGDSYTIGQNVSESERWPVLFAKSMTGSGIAVAPPDIIAKTGWTTANLLGNTDQVGTSAPYDLVSLLIGVNNEYQGLGIEQYRIEFEKLLEKSIRFAGGKPGRVFVLSIPDWGATPAGASGRELIGKEIDAYNLVARQACEQEKVLFIDITPISRKALDDPSLLAGDRLHYSGKMHQLWVNEAIPRVKALL